MKIALTGGVDKRVLAYPLLGVLKNLGKTLVIAEDGAFRRLDKQFRNHFSLENCEFFIVHDIEEAYQQNRFTSELPAYENVLVLSVNEPSFLEGAKIVRCEGVQKYFDLQEVLEIDEVDKPVTPLIVLSTEKLKQVDGTNLVLDKSAFFYVHACEDYQAVRPCTHPALLQVTHQLIGAELDLDVGKIKAILQMDKE